MCRGFFCEAESGEQHKVGFIIVLVPLVAATCRVAMMNLQQGLPSAVSVLVPVKPPVFVGVEKAQLTVSERPRGFGHVCKQLSLAGLLRRVSDICACLCQAGISARVLGKHRSCPWLFWQSLQPKVVFLHIIPLE